MAQVNFTNFDPAQLSADMRAQEQGYSSLAGRQAVLSNANSGKTHRRMLRKLAQKQRRAERLADSAAEYDLISAAAEFGIDLR